MRFNMRANVPHVESLLFSEGSPPTPRHRADRADEIL
jgi:hypothetical protein